jgi:hypothetical protein
MVTDMILDNLRQNHKILDVYRGFVVHAGFFLVIAASQVAGAQQVTAADVDTDVLSAILKAALSDAGTIDLRVDPRPLIADPTFLYTVQPEAIASVPALVVSRRADVIRAAGLSTVDTAILEQARSCPGALVISKPDSLGRIDRGHVAGCPEEPFAVLAVGPPRPGDTVLPADQVYDRDAEMAARGYWATRVIRTTLGHGRSSVYAADYVLTKRAATWVVIKIVGLMYSE